MANTKMTKKEIVTLMLADENIKANQVFVDYLTHELELLNKKSVSKKASANAEQNEVLKAVLLEVLSETPHTVSEIQKMDARISPANDITNQRVTSLLKSLSAEGLVERTVDKKKAVFALVQ